MKRPAQIDGLHIDVGEAWELLLWTREFGCTAEELREAVRLVGTRARDVRGWLRGDRHT